MDNKVLQQQLKACIAKHQIILRKVKLHPEDETLLKSLKEVQNEIAKLGIMQKKLGKPRVVVVTPSGNPTANKSIVKQEDALQCFSNGIETTHSTEELKSISVEEENRNSSDNTTNNSERTGEAEAISTLDGVIADTKEVTTLDQNKSGSENLEKYSVNAVDCENDSSQSVLLNVNSHPENELKDDPIFKSKDLKPDECTKTLLDESTKPEITNSSVETKDVIVPTTAVETRDNSLKCMTTVRGSVANVAPISAFTSSTGKFLVKSPIKIRVPPSSEGSVVLVTTAKVKPSPSTPLFRFASCQQTFTTLRPTNPGTTRVWFNVTGASKGQNTQKVSPTTTLRTGQTETFGTLQKVRIISGTLPILQPRLPTATSERPCSTQLQAVLTSPKFAANNQKDDITDLSEDHCDVQSTSQQRCDVQLYSTRVERNVSPEQTFSTTKPIFTDEPQTSIEVQDDKVNFLDRLELVSLKKAEKIRNRRYKRRRATAHPVYSGGMYVSTTAADSSKRILPADLIGFEEIPIKRPRGRPRNMFKTSPSPIIPLDGDNDEAMRIFEQTRPAVVDAVRKSPNAIPEGPGVKTRKNKKKSDSEREDLCAICGKAGKMLMCDTCYKVHHLTCVQLHEIPTGMWYCAVCKLKFNDRSSAPPWPGLMSIVHSYVTFDAERDERIEKAQEKQKLERSRKIKLEQQMKSLTSLLKEKVAMKNKHKASLQRTMGTCEHLTAVLERIRCAINRTLDTS